MRICHLCHGQLFSDGMVIIGLYVLEHADIVPFSNGCGSTKQSTFRNVGVAALDIDSQPSSLCSCTLMMHSAMKKENIICVCTLQSWFDPICDRTSKSNNKVFNYLCYIYTSDYLFWYIHNLSSILTPISLFCKNVENRVL